MSLIDLRKEFVKLQKEFAGGRATKLKKNEIEHRITVLKKAMELKEETALPDPARTGPASARDIPTKEVVIDGETKVTKPLKPEGPDPIVKKPRGPKKPKVTEAKEASPVATVTSAAAAVAATATPVKTEVKTEAKSQKREAKVPPKVVFDEVSIKEPKTEKPKKAPKERSKSPKPQKAPKATVTEAPVVAVTAPVVVKLPGGVRKIED